MLWQEVGSEDLTPKFKVFEGDLTHLNGIYIGLTDDAEKEEELQKLLPEGTKFLTEPTKDWDIFIHCGFIL